MLARGLPFKSLAIVQSFNSVVQQLSRPPNNEARLESFTTCSGTDWISFSATVAVSPLNLTRKLNHLRFFTWAADAIPYHARHITTNKNTCNSPANLRQRGCLGTLSMDRQHMCAHSRNLWRASSGDKAVLRSQSNKKPCENSWNLSVTDTESMPTAFSFSARMKHHEIKTHGETRIMDSSNHVSSQGTLAILAHTPPSTSALQLLWRDRTHRHRHGCCSWPSTQEELPLRALAGH